MIKYFCDRCKLEIDKKLLYYKITSKKIGYCNYYEIFSEVTLCNRCTDGFKKFMLQHEE